MNNQYEVIKEFECCGKPMVTVRIGNAAHVMSQEELRKVYGRNHQDRWKTKANWIKYVPRIEYDKKNVS